VNKKFDSRVQQSVNFSDVRKGGFTDSDFTQGPPQTQRDWRKQTLMQKAKHTLNEIHEKARFNKNNNLFDRVAASAGTMGISKGELDVGQNVFSDQRNKI